MNLNLDEAFLKHFSDKLCEQNIELLKQICKDYNWSYSDMYSRFIEDKEDFTLKDIDFNDQNIIIRNQWNYNNNIYYVEEETNNVYLNGEFQGKRYDNQLYTECEET